MENDNKSVDQDSQTNDTPMVGDMFKNWFLDYASYVILERAVPAIEDGLKPVQRRILHALHQMDDGRFNKVANVIGQTMQYHPHGDASIGDALVNMGQKELLFDTQGNWGDVRTGDSAAAARYIEVRLSKFSKDVAFNHATTNWQLSYDGRKKEPIALPMKFPLLLFQGTDGIAVGLSTKILPHNFNELIKGSIDILKGKKTKLYPDFFTGGMVDVSEYSSGARGGKVKVRAKIEVIDKKNISIKDIPFGTTTSSLIDSILKANDKGKIKIKKVIDNTAKDVDIQIELQPGTDPDVAIDALYAFTDCQISISTNACVIIDEKPVFTSVDEMLKISTENTKDLLRRELEINLSDLNEKWHYSSLEKIFIEKRIYRDIEEATTWEEVIAKIDKGLQPYKKLFKRLITEEDIVRLTEIKIKRISKFDSFKADELIKNIEESIKQTLYDLEHLTDYAINYFEQLYKKYSKGRERKTEIKGFETIEVKQVVANNTKLFVNREEGFIGTSLKKDELAFECSDLDDIIVFTRSGKMMVTKVGDKKFVGKEIMHIAVWQKSDERTTYNLVYYDGTSKRTFAKRFNVAAITRDKEYVMTQGTPGTKVLYFTSNANAETEIVKVQLHPNSSARVKEFEYDFATLEIKGRQAIGNILTKFPIRKIELKSKGESSIGGFKLWFDKKFGRLYPEQRDIYLGEFNTSDQIIVAYKDGNLELTNFELTNKYDSNEILHIGKFDPKQVFSVAYYDGQNKTYYVKRFEVELKSERTKSSIISDHKDSKLAIISINDPTIITYNYIKGKDKEKYEAEVNISELIDVKGWKALGNKLSLYTVAGKIEESVTHKPLKEIEVGDTIELDVKPIKPIGNAKQGDLF
jgi:topoisomerase-4 subunit A